MWRPKFTDIVTTDARPFFWFGKIYEFFINDKGNYEARPVVITDADRDEFGAEVDKMLEEKK